MNVEVHLLVFNESELLPFTLLHYGAFAERIIVHDGGSTDSSREIAKEYGAEVVDFITDGVNDKVFKEAKEGGWWRGTTSDWVIPADCDELLYAPSGWSDTLAAFEDQGIAVCKPRGYEMFSDEMPSLEKGQITEQIKMGCEDAKWYAKPILFRPSLIKEFTFSAGCHTCWATLHDGKKISDPQVPTKPEVILCHYHHIGGLERITRRYAGQQSRHSETNKKNRWGNYSAPHKHALEKRKMILAGLRQVIA